jgi:hypothetical protein
MAASFPAAGRFALRPVQAHEIRRAVSWFAVHFDKDGEGILVARKNPGPAGRASDEIYFARGVEALPEDPSGFHKNITADGIKDAAFCDAWYLREHSRSGRGGRGLGRCAEWLAHRRGLGLDAMPADTPESRRWRWPHRRGAKEDWQLGEVRANAR